LDSRFGGVDAFSYNSTKGEPLVEHFEYVIGGWPWQILDAIRAVVTAGQQGKILFIFCQVSNARFHPFRVGQISGNFAHNTRIGEAMKTFGTKF